MGYKIHENLTVAGRKSKALQMNNQKAIEKRKNKLKKYYADLYLKLESKLYEWRMRESYNLVRLLLSHRVYPRFNPQTQRDMALLQIDKQFDQCLVKKDQLKASAIKQAVKQLVSDRRSRLLQPTLNFEREPNPFEEMNLVDTATLRNDAQRIRQIMRRQRTRENDPFRQTYNQRREREWRDVLLQQRRLRERQNRQRAEQIRRRRQRQIQRNRQETAQREGLMEQRLRGMQRNNHNWVFDFPNITNIHQIDNNNEIRINDAMRQNTDIFANRPSQNNPIIFTHNDFLQNRQHRTTIFPTIDIRQVLQRHRNRTNENIFQNQNATNIFAIQPDNINQQIRTDPMRNQVQPANIFDRQNTNINTSMEQGGFQNILENRRLHENSRPANIQQNIFRRNIQSNQHEEINFVANNPQAIQELRPLDIFRRNNRTEQNQANLHSIAQTNTENLNEVPQNNQDNQTTSEIETIHNNYVTQINEIARNTFTTTENQESENIATNINLQETQVRVNSIFQTNDVQRSAQRAEQIINFHAETLEQVHSQENNRIN